MFVAFKTAVYGESNVIYSKFRIAYSNDPILRGQHNTNKQMRQAISNCHDIRWYMIISNQTECDAVYQ